MEKVVEELKNFELNSYMVKKIYKIAEAMILKEKNNHQNKFKAVLEEY